MIDKIKEIGIGFSEQNKITADSYPATEIGVRTAKIIELAKVLKKVKINKSFIKANFDEIHEALEWDNFHDENLALELIFRPKDFRQFVIENVKYYVESWI